MSKKSKQTDWTVQHHDGVSEKTMIGRPVKSRGTGETAYLLGTPANTEHLRESIVQVHGLEILAWLDGNLVGHVRQNEDAHYPDDGSPYVYDGRVAIVKALRGLADRIEANTGDDST